MDGTNFNEMIKKCASFEFKKANKTKKMNLSQENVYFASTVTRIN